MFMKCVFLMIIDVEFVTCDEGERGVVFKS